MRLLVRERHAYTRRWARLLVEPVAVVSFVMSQKPLGGIMDRAERLAALPLGSPAPSRSEGGRRMSTVAAMSGHRDGDAQT